MKHTTTETIRNSGTALLLTAVFTYLLSAAVFACGGRINGAIFPVAMAAALASAPLLTGHTKKRVIAMSSMLALALAATGILVGHLLPDYTSDGCWYHQEGIALMLDGWNPYRDGAPEGGALLWTLHYAKSMEIISAAIASAVGSIEAGKAVNFILTAAAALLVYDFGRRHLASAKRAAALALTATANPVVIAQLPTYYIDYTLYIYILLTIILLVDAAGSRRTAAPYLLAGAVTVLAIGTKFNIFFMQGVTLIAAAGWCAATRHRHEARTIIVTGACALAVGLLAAWHPYVGNFIGHGNPLYPLLGEGAQDIMSENTPDIYTGNRFADFAISLLYPERPSYDGRINGFTPLMVLLLGISALTACKLRRDSDSRLPLFIMACALASCFFFDQSLWARYNCQLWLVPVSAYFCLLRSGDRAHTLVWCRRLTLLCIVAAAAVTIRYTLPASIHLSIWQRNIYSLRRETPARIIDLDRQTARHFAEQGIDTESISESEVRPGNILVATGYVFKGVFPMMEVTRAEWDSMLKHSGGRLLEHQNPRRAVLPDLSQP